MRIHQGKKKEEVYTYVVIPKKPFDQITHCKKKKKKIKNIFIL